jgi:hypothetical protein
MAMTGHTFARNVVMNEHLKPYIDKQLPEYHKLAVSIAGTYELMCHALGHMGLPVAEYQEAAAYVRQQLNLPADYCGMFDSRLDNPLQRGGYNDCRNSRNPATTTTDGHDK